MLSFGLRDLQTATCACTCVKRPDYHRDTCLITPLIRLITSQELITNAVPLRAGSESDRLKLSSHCWAIKIRWIDDGTFSLVKWTGRLRNWWMDIDLLLSVASTLDTIPRALEQRSSRPLLPYAFCRDLNPNYSNLQDFVMLFEGAEKRLQFIFSKVNDSLESHMVQFLY